MYHRPKLLVEAEMIAVREEFLRHEDEQDLYLAGKDYERLDALLDEYLLIPKPRGPHD